MLRKLSAVDEATIGMAMIVMVVAGLSGWGLVSHKKLQECRATVLQLQQSDK